MQTNPEERQEIGRWLAGFFLEELDEAKIRFYRSDAGHAALSNLRRFPVLDGLTDALEALADDTTDVGTVRLDLAAAYGRLFLVGGPRSVPLHASTYLSERGLLMQGPEREAEAILGRLGLSVPPGFREPADHVGILLNVLAELATERGETLPDERSYLTGHLLTWVPTLAALCGRLSPVPLYRELGTATLGWLRQLEADLSAEQQTA